MTSTVEVLKEAKKDFSDYDCWCPRGMTDKVDDKVRSCFIYTLVKAQNRVHRSSLETVFVTAQEAAKSVIGTTNITSYNDGTFEFASVTNRERWETLCKVLDRAIELAEHGEKP